MRRQSGRGDERTGRRRQERKRGEEEEGGDLFAPGLSVHSNLQPLWQTLTACQYTGPGKGVVKH